MSLQCELLVAAEAPHQEQNPDNAMLVCIDQIKIVLESTGLQLQSSVEFRPVKVTKNDFIAVRSEGSLR